MNDAPVQSFTAFLRSRGFPFPLSFRWSDTKQGKAVITIWRQLLTRNPETGAVTYYIPPHPTHTATPFMKKLHEHVGTAMDHGWPIVGVVQETEANLPIRVVGEKGFKRGRFCTWRFPLLQAAVQPDGALILTVVGDVDDIM